MRFANIQALRFVAAASVLLFHLGPIASVKLNVSEPLLDAFGDGFLGLGVYVFFAISGYVLAHSLRTTPVPQFLAWRAIRIYVPYWLLIAVLMVLLFLASAPLPPVARPLANGLLLLPSGEGRALYLLGGVEWTLVYEMFFGLALGLCALAGPRRGVTGGAALWLALCVAKAIIAPGVVPTYPTWKAIVLSAANVPFLLGVLSYELRGRAMDVVRFAAPFAVPTLFSVGRLIARPDIAVMVQGAACAILVAWCAAAKQLDARHPLVRYGDWSYGVYLCHGIVILQVCSAGEYHGFLPPSLASAIVAGGTALGVGLAYGCLESAVYRRLRERFAPARAVVPPLKRAA